MARSRTVERRKQREQQQRRQRQVIVVAAVAIVAVVAIILIILGNLPAEAPIPEDVAERYAGIPQSTSVEGFPVLGDQDAPVSLVEYSNFECPACKSFYDSVAPALVERAKAGEISFTFVPLYFPNSAAGKSAARAAVCAGEQDAFWTTHSAFFTWQGLYANAAFTASRISTGINGLGLNRGEWDQCMSSDRPDKVLEAAIAQVDTIPNFPGTPTVMVNGSMVSAELGAINTAIAQGLAAAPRPSVEATAEATPETEATEEATEAAS